MTIFFGESVTAASLAKRPGFSRRYSVNWNDIGMVFTATIAND